jgi:exonuclease VII small subunit
MSQAIDEARSELEAAQSALEAALRAWDESVSELWRTSLTLTQAQKRVTRAHELLRSALNAADDGKLDEGQSGCL